MNRQKLQLLAFVAIALLAAIGFRSKSLASQIPPPLAEGLLHMDDLPRDASWFQEKVPSMVENTGRFVGLSVQGAGFVEGEAVTFIGGHPGENPIVVTHGLYRYQTAEQALAQFERLRQEAHSSPLGHATPIVRQSARSFPEVKGQILEASDPIGTAYWFVGVRHDTLTILITLGPGESGQRELLETVLPRVIERLRAAR